MNTREAKAYLIEQIVAEASLEHVDLSQIERSMLEYSESEGTPANLEELNAEFDRGYDQKEYESKIAALIDSLRHRLQEDDQRSLQLWNDAVVALSDEDHYLLVLIQYLKPPLPLSAKRYDRIKLVLTAILCIVVAFLVEMFLESLGIHTGRQH